MSTIIAVAYHDQHLAAEVVDTLRQLESEQLIDLANAVYVTKDFDGKIHVRQSAESGTSRAIAGGFAGLLIGSFFLLPVVGATIGAVAAARTGRLPGIDDAFARDLSDKLKPGGLALVLMVQDVSADAVLDRVSRFGGEVLHTTLEPEQEARLREALDAGQDAIAMERAPINLDAEVQCSDGLAGRTTRMVVDPTTRTITHLVVKEPQRRGVERLVPIALVEQSAPHAVRLRISRADFAELPSYEMNETITPEIDFSAQPMQGMSGFATATQGRYTINRDIVPDDMLVARRGNHVEATDGRVGKIDDILANAEGVIEYIVLRTGHLWGARDVTIPVSEAVRADDGVVYLKLSKAQIGDLARDSGSGSQSNGTITLYNDETGALLGTITDAQLQMLTDQLEEESTGDDNYYINQATIDLLKQQGADKALLTMLRAAVSAKGEAEIRWTRQ